MKHLAALLIKFVIVALILEIFLNIVTPLGFWPIIVIALVLTLAAYFIGDLPLLKRFGNFVATLCDIVLAVIVIYIFNYIYGGISFLNALIGGILIGLGEYIFHIFLPRILEDEKEKD